MKIKNLFHVRVSILNFKTNFLITSLTQSTLTSLFNPFFKLKNKKKESFSKKIVNFFEKKLLIKKYNFKKYQSNYAFEENNSGVISNNPYNKFSSSKFE